MVFPEPEGPETRRRIPVRVVTWATLIRSPAKAKLKGGRFEKVNSNCGRDPFGMGLMVGDEKKNKIPSESIDVRAFFIRVPPRELALVAQLDRAPDYESGG